MSTVSGPSPAPIQIQPTRPRAPVAPRQEATSSAPTDGSSTAAGDGFDDDNSSGMGWEAFGSMPAGGTPIQAHDARAGATAVGEARTTGVGSEFQVSSEIGPVRTRVGDFSESFDRPWTVTLRYDDKYGYFGGADALKAFVKIDGYHAHHGGAPTPLRDIELPDVELKRQPDGEYVGTFQEAEHGDIGDNEEVFTSAKVAFHDDQGRWDSNFGDNYEVRPL